MAGYKIQLKDKNGNRQYPVSTTNVVVDADGVSVADLLDRKQPTLVSGVNIKTINGKTLLGEGDLVIEGGNGDGSASVETRVLYVYLEGAELTEEEKTYNKETYDKIANGENVQLVFDVLGIPITHAFYDGVLVFTCSVVVIEGSALYAQGRLFSDGNYEYEEGVIGSNSYPIYYSYDGTPLTEEQKAANKTAVDKYAENESIILYPYNSSVGHPFDVVLTLSGGVWKMAELTNYIFASFNDDGTAMYYVKVTVNQDGDVQVEYSAQSPLVLASKAYVDSKVGSSSSDDSYPLYMPMSEDEVLTSAQLAANKAAYDAVMSDGAQPVLYIADGGKSATVFMSEGFPFEGRAILVGSYPYGMDDTGAFMAMLGYKVELMSDGRMQNLVSNFYVMPRVNEIALLPEVVFFLPLIDGGTLPTEQQEHNAKSVKTATTYGCRAWVIYNGFFSAPATVAMLDADEGVLLQVLSSAVPNQGTTDLSVKASWYAINLDGSVVKQA